MVVCSDKMGVVQMYVVIHVDNVEDFDAVCKRAPYNVFVLSYL